MAGNTRGKLKEEFEGVHRNFEWVKEHLTKSLILIEEKHPHLRQGVETLAAAVDSLDELAQGIYAKI